MMMMVMMMGMIILMEMMMMMEMLVMMMGMTVGEEKKTCTEHLPYGRLSSVLAIFQALLI